MIGAKVVETANDIHAGLQGFRLLGQGTSAPGQGGQTLAEGGIEPFDIGGVNATQTLAGLDQLLYHLPAALHNPPLNSQLSGCSLFDHLNNRYLRPGPQLTPAELTQPRHFRPKGPLKSFNIAGQAINGQQQRSTQGDGPNLVSHRLDQALISVGTDRSTQPQPGRDHHRHRQPHRPALSFHFDLVGLNLLQVKLALAHRMLMHPLAMFSGSLPSTFDRPLVKAIGCHNRLQRTAMGQQGQHDHHQLGVGFEPVKDRAFTGRKSGLADLTPIPLFLLTMDADVTSADLSSCRTVKIRAKYLLWVYRSHSWIWCRNLPVCPVNPLFSNFPFLFSNHALLECYQKTYIEKLLTK